MYKNILVPVDLAHGDVGERILRLARALGGPEARITALYVAEVVPSFVANEIPVDVLEANIAENEARLKALAHAVDPAAAVALLTGQAPTAILAEAEEIGADLIVIGSHVPGLRDYLIGSTAARVVRHAHCSVLIDRGGSKEA